MQLNLPNTPTTTLETVLVEKVFHKGFLHGLAESGGNLVIPDFPAFFIKVIPIDAQFNKVQILSKGKESNVRNAIFFRPKVVANRTVVKQLKLPMKKETKTPLSMPVKSTFSVKEQQEERI